MQIEGTFYKVIIHPKYSDNIYYVDCLGQGCTVNYVSYCPDIGESDSWNHNWFSRFDVFSYILPQVKTDHPKAEITLEILQVNVLSVGTTVIQ